MEDRSLSSSCLSLVYLLLIYIYRRLIFIYIYKMYKNKYMYKV
jgi:hypothetical protein